MKESWSEKDEIICLALFFRQKKKVLTQGDIECISRIVGKSVKSVERKLENFNRLEAGDDSPGIATDFCKKVWRDFRLE